MTTAWIIGSRGLLGTALVSAIDRRTNWTLLETEPLPWGDAVALSRAATVNIERLLDAAAAADSPWSVIWVGGSGVTSTPERQLDEEFGQLDSVLSAISSRLEHAPSQGAIFFSSSAGGVYGGSEDPPFTETTAVSPISPYGAFKIRAEAAIQHFGRQHGISTLIGRIANLYGPGQKLDKMQGLISQIARAQYSPAPASIFVSLDTVRDYLFVEDGAELILDALEQLQTHSLKESTHVVKILASGQGVTIGELLGHFRALAKGHPHIMLGQSGAATLQAHDLRLRSVVWPHLDRRQLTPLPVGIHATMLSVLAELVQP
jgi:UDP-glucose 4-epimerase